MDKDLALGMSTNWFRNIEGWAKEGLDELQDYIRGPALELEGMVKEGRGQISEESLSSDDAGAD
jgi:hypothetical protein